MMGTFWTFLRHVQMWTLHRKYSPSVIVQEGPTKFHQIENAVIMLRNLLGSFMNQIHPSQFPHYTL